MSVAEATTLILLVCFAVPLQHLAGLPIGVRVMGPIHGLMFLAYAWVVVQTVAGADGAWRRRRGCQLADDARERRPGRRGALQLFITGYAENATLANGFLDPGMEMITKPFAVEAPATKIKDG